MPVFGNYPQARYVSDGKRSGTAPRFLEEAIGAASVLAKRLLPSATTAMKRVADDLPEPLSIVSSMAIRVPYNDKIPVLSFVSRESNSSVADRYDRGTYLRRAIDSMVEPRLQESLSKRFAALIVITRMAFTLEEIGPVSVSVIRRLCKQYLPVFHKISIATKAIAVI